MANQLEICDNFFVHEQKPVSLIPTMKFPGFEMWCPSCGRTFEIFNDCETVEADRKLKMQHNKYAKKAEAFLKGEQETYEYEFSYRPVQYFGDLIHELENAEGHVYRHIDQSQAFLNSFAQYPGNQMKIELERVSGTRHIVYVKSGG